jgi:hypothetical protein
LSVLLSRVMNAHHLAGLVKDGTLNTAASTGLGGAVHGVAAP